MTGRIEKTVFISYRRTNLPWALNIYQDLTHNGYDVFFDYQSIDSGDFEKIILDNIKARAHFVVILTPSALDRCKEPNDWLRREIETAIDEKRNIVPLMMDGFDFGSPSVVQALTGKLATLSNKNGLPIYASYFFEGMEKLRSRYLNIALSNVPLRPLSSKAQEITEAQKTAASKAPPVQKEELTAQEWFERGYKFVGAKSFDEAIRCFSEAIDINPDFAEAYNNRGGAYFYKDEIENALNDFNKSIHLKPDYATAYYNRSRFHQLKGNHDKAIADSSSAIERDMNYANAYHARGVSLLIKGDNVSALSDFQKAVELNSKSGMYRGSLIGTLKLLRQVEKAKEEEIFARELIANENQYNQACFEAICGNTENALKLLKIALQKKQVTKEWICQDPDLKSICNDPRFKELVGE